MFFNTSKPYKKIQENVLVYDENSKSVCAMILNDRKEEEQQNEKVFYAAIFSAIPQIMFNLIKFSRDYTGSFEAYTKEIRLEKDTVMINSFVIPSNLLMIACYFHFILLDENLDILKIVPVFDVFYDIFNVDICILDKYTSI